MPDNPKNSDSEVSVPINHQPEPQVTVSSGQPTPTPASQPVVQQNVQPQQPLQPTVTPLQPTVAPPPPEQQYPAPTQPNVAVPQPAVPSQPDQVIVNPSNQQLLGQVDASSLFQSDVQSSGPYVYEDPTQVNQSAIEQSSAQRKQKLKKLSFSILAILVLGGGLVFGLMRILGTNSGYVKQSFSDNGYTYTVLFDKSAAHESSNNLNYLTGKDYVNGNNIGVMALPSGQSNCKTQNPALIDYFNLSIYGQSYPVCTDTANNVVSVNFKYKANWQEVLVYATNGAESVSSGTAKTILGSLSIK